MRVFGPIAAAQGHYEASNVATHLQTGGAHRACHDMGQQRIRGDDHIRTRHSDTQNEPTELLKKLAQCLTILIAQYGKSRQRRTRVSVE
jgi:hypothetical protein